VHTRLGSFLVFVFTVRCLVFDAYRLIIIIYLLYKKCLIITERPFIPFNDFKLKFHLG
jgi:hypothetical protein